MAPQKTGRVFGALALLVVFLPLTTLAGCKLFNRQKKQFGEDCTTDIDCDSLECATYGSVCTKACVFEKDCGAGYVCRARDGKPGDACAKPTGNPTGQSCNNASECQSGNCLKPVGQGDAVGFCSAHCQTEADCPDNYKVCHEISDSGSVGFCLPGGGGSAAIPGGATAQPIYVAPRPATTVTKTVTTTTTTTTVPPATTPLSTGNFLHPTASATATAAPTATATTKPTATPTATVAPTGKRPPTIIIRPPHKKN
jgi:hypothetical protein